LKTGKGPHGFLQYNIIFPVISFIDVSILLHYGSNDLLSQNVKIGNEEERWWKNKKCSKGEKKETEKTKVKWKVDTFFVQKEWRNEKKKKEREREVHKQTDKQRQTVSSYSTYKKLNVGGACARFPSSLSFLKWSFGI
jgi:hypothetical protein